MDVKFINPFLNASTNVIKTMAFTEVTGGKPVLRKEHKTFGAITGVIGLTGDFLVGNMMVSFEESCILSIVSKMLMEDFKEISQEVVDAVGEITNMISGGAKRELSEQGIVLGMALPIMIVGKDLELKQLANAPVVQIPFTTAAGNFVVEANLIEKK